MDKQTKRRKLLELERMIQIGASERNLHQLRVELGIATSDADELPTPEKPHAEWQHDIEIYYRMKALGLSDDKILFAFNLHPQTLNRFRAKNKITKSHITGRKQFYEKQLHSKERISQ